ncbi:MAG: beta-galactosidase trimerization domain-containing protein [Candidatus Omnitrophota bacterium]
MKKKWYQKAYRRNVVDMHIADWDARFMSEFDPKKYAEMMALAQVQSAVIHAHSHAGLCYFPTRLGQMHRGLKGRNILAEVIEECHRKGIYVVVYYSVIFDTSAFRTHPDWHVVDVDGTSRAEKSRYGLCCPNSPYRNYASGIAKEICQDFDFEGIRFDMTFWPAICYCPYCQKRFAREVGGSLPRVINWEDPVWVSFQRKREEWLVDFATLMTSTVKKLKPEVTVEHQASTYNQSWVLGVTHPMTRQCDFLQGDFYGDALQGSFARKLFYNLSENLPYGFETSICVNLGYHTGMKSKELLQTKACAALADGGTFIFIDAVDPVGTLNPAVYQKMHDVFEETKVYELYLGGEMVQDVAIYLSTESKCDFADNGKSLENVQTGNSPLSSKMPHVDGAVNVCKTLINNHIPFGIITKKRINELSRYKMLVLPNVLMMDKEEASAIREYVRSGGTLYASKYTSLLTKDGVRQKDFLLADLFGVSYAGETKERFTYIAPAEGSQDLFADFSQKFADFSQKYPVGLDSYQMKVKALPGAKVLGYLVLPYTNPADTTRFASIHSNPPGVQTDQPAVVFNKFGKGKVLYAAGEIESSELDIHRDIFSRFLKLLVSSYSLEAEAPKSVEVTTFHQRKKRRYLINLLNFQKELPNIPVAGIKISLKLKSPSIPLLQRGRRGIRLVVLPDEKILKYKLTDGYVEFGVPKLNTFMMLALDYR